MANTTNQILYSAEEYSRTYSGVIPAIEWTQVDEHTITVKQRDLVIPSRPLIIKSGVQFIEIDPDQIWFWSKKWQKDFAEAKEEVEQGLTEDFDSMDDFIDSLDD